VNVTGTLIKDCVVELVKVSSKSALVVTAVVAVAVLLAGVRSCVAEATVAVALSVGPIADAGTAATTVTLWLAPEAVAPAQVQTTGVAALQLPPALGVADAKVVPAGSGSVIDTASAGAGPLLVAVAT
jgi:hypothetical protein